MMYVYSVFDNVAEKYGNPFVAVSHKVAFRDFNVGMASMNAMIKKDYALIAIGRFNELTGTIEPIVPEILIGSMKPIPEDMSELQNNNDSQVENLKEMLKNE